MFAVYKLYVVQDCINKYFSYFVVFRCVCLFVCASDDNAFLLQINVLLKKFQRYKLQLFARARAQRYKNSVGGFPTWKSVEKQKQRDRDIFFVATGAAGRDFLRSVDSVREKIKKSSLLYVFSSRLSPDARISTYGRAPNDYPIRKHENSIGSN